MKRTVCLSLVCCMAAGLSAQENITYQRPPEAIAKLVDAPLTPRIVFTHDNSLMLLLERSDFPSIEELSRPELRIAGMRINPDNFGPGRASYNIGMKAKRISDGKEFEIKNLPSPLLISGVSVSPDNKKLAFLQNFPDRIELWTVDLAGFTASRLTNRKINAVFGSSMNWINNSGQILITAVPEQLPPMPEKGRVPTGPVVEQNLGKKAPNRTYQDLLRNPYDEALLDYYGTSELWLINLDGTEKNLNRRAIYTYASLSPDGRMILTNSIHKPYSYIVPYSRFPQLVQVIDTDGKLIKDIIDIPLTDNIPSGFNAVQKGPRNHSWRSDQPSILYWVEAQDEGDPKIKADIRDKVYQQAYPFDSKPTELASLALRYAGITWGNSKTAIIREGWWKDRKQKIYTLNPSNSAKKLLIDRSTEDAYNDPGNMLLAPNQYGRYVLRMTKDEMVFLTGNGSSPEGDMPFLDKMDLKSGKKTRLWRCQAPYFESVIELLDDKKGTFITSRESQNDNPNYYLRSIGSNKLTQITYFPHPYPEMKEVKKQVLKYNRPDGVELTADLYLPPGYKKEQGPLPTFFWAYPQEFKSRENAGQVKGSPHTFVRLSWGGPIYWAIQGYAILNNVSIPIVGEGNEEPNDTYVTQLVASAKAAIDHGASLGVADPTRVAAGGHSYGAFMTANLLAHSDLFKAGIARSGAYNRTLTPFGFQSEERTYWEAPDVYFKMSAFSYSDKIKEPILFIHGEADNNSGTFPIQTERFYNAIKGHGGTARFVLLPYESHGYQAKESIMHTLWEMDQWLEKYVKGK